MTHQASNIVPVVFCVDNIVDDYLSVTIQSIIENASPDKNYQLYVFDVGIKKQAIVSLERQIDKYENFSIEFFNIERKIQEHKKIFMQSLGIPYITSATYGRFFIPEILSHFEKVIYSDVDVIYEEDISGLMNYDLGANYIGAIIDCVEEIQRRNNKISNRSLQFKRLGVLDHHPHVNAGILVINVQEWLKDDVKGKLLDLLSKEVFSLADQDAINIVCKDKIFFLDRKWNVPIRLDWILPKMKKNQKDEHSLFLLKKWMDILASQKGGAIHFSGDKKPWDFRNIKKSDRWWFYAAKTDFYMQFIDKFIPAVSHTAKTEPFEMLFKFLFIPFFKIKFYQKRTKFYFFGINLFTLKKRAL